MNRASVDTLDGPAPSGAYSQALVASGFVFVSGVGPYEPATRHVVGTTIEEQTDQVLRNVGAILRAAGCDLDDVVNVTAFLEDLERDWVGFDATYRRFFGAPHPARTTVGAKLKNMLVEIAVVAIAPAASGG
jgi:2-iminobutanoate/2-iminopropanoate deaminase